MIHNQFIYAGWDLFGVIFVSFAYVVMTLWQFVWKRKKILEGIRYIFYLPYFWKHCWDTLWWFSCLYLWVHSVPRAHVNCSIQIPLLVTLFPIAYTSVGVLLCLMQQQELYTVRATAQLNCHHGTMSLQYCHILGFFLMKLSFS